MFFFDFMICKFFIFVVVFLIGAFVTVFFVFVVKLRFIIKGAGFGYGVGMS